MSSTSQTTKAPLSLEYVPVTASRAIAQGDLGRMLDVDPAGGVITITVPAIFGRGFNCSIRQVGLGTVQFVAGGAATLVSAVGATPTLAGQWSAAVLDNRTGTQWVLAGGIA